jgi:arylsulfatase A-like enzyme
MFSRRSFLPLLAAPLAAQPASAAPNIVLILTDDQGYGDVSLHGNPVLETPHMDSIAKAGARCTHHHSSPVCSPTRSSLLTGRYNYRTGVVDTYLGRSMMHGEEETLAEMLRKRGYRTGIFGKWHLGDNYPLRAVDQGFEESLVLNGGGLTQPGDPPEALTGVKPSYFDPVLSRNGKWEPGKGYCTDIFFREAAQFIGAKSAKPFFCYLATNAPHDPLQIADSYVAPFRAKGLDENTAKTYGMLKNLDDNLGNLLRRLDELKLTENTIVIFLTDNGPQRARFNAGLRAVKGTVYEGGIKVPLFVRWPARIQPGTIVDRLSAHIDLTPTLLEAAGAKSERPLDGRSLLPLLVDSKAKESWSDRTVFLQWHRGDAPEPFNNAAVLTQRYKLVNGKELYDLSADPGETKDLAAAEPSMVRQLRISYEAWFKDVSGTRGYAPPRIAIGAKAPTLLTRQDWRGPKATWTPTGLGFWEVDVTHEGAYDVTLLFDAPAAEATLQATWLDEQKVAAGQKRLDLKNVKLPLGPARFEASVAGFGLRYAYFSKVSEGV